MRFLSAVVLKWENGAHDSLKALTFFADIMKVFWCRNREVWGTPLFFIGYYHKLSQSACVCVMAIMYIDGLSDTCDVMFGTQTDFNLLTYLL